MNLFNQQNIPEEVLERHKAVFPKIGEWLENKKFVKNSLDAFADKVCKQQAGTKTSSSSAVASLHLWQAKDFLLCPVISDQPVHDRTEKDPEKNRDELKNMDAYDIHSRRVQLGGTENPAS